MNTFSLFFNKIIRFAFKIKHTPSYSQSGEDLILNNIFAFVKNGFYVDVGACEPYIQSNTQYFYNKGWKGINIDANEISIKKLNAQRKRDKNILAFVSDKEEEVEYFYYDQPFYNGSIIQKNIPAKLLCSKKITSKNLTQILLTENVKLVNFLSVDVEGNEYNVLASLDYTLIKPQVIVVESFNIDLRNELNSKISLLLFENGYLLISRTITNSIYITKEYAKERFGLL